jgi:hypothetical protein
VWKQFKPPLFEKEELDMYIFASKLSITELSVDLAELKDNLEAVRRAEKSQIQSNPHDCIKLFC